MISYSKMVFVLLLFIVTNNYAQEQNDTIVPPKNSVMVSPLSLIDPINPSFLIGYQRRFTPKIELQVEGGYIINKALFHYLINSDESSDEYANKGYKVKAELKNYFVNDENVGLYYSCELLYLKNISDVQNQFVVADTSYDYSFDLPNDGGEYGYTDYFTNDKTKYEISAKIGLKIIVQPFFMEMAIGLGVAYRINKHSGRENLNDESIDKSWLNDNLKGSMYIPALPINFKIGGNF